VRRTARDVPGEGWVSRRRVLQRIPCRRGAGSHLGGKQGTAHKKRLKSRAAIEKNLSSSFRDRR